MEVIMRRARRGDADAINDIFNQAVSEGESNLDIDCKDQEYRLQWLAYHDRRHPVYVGELKGQVVCWVALSPYSGHYAYDGVAELEMYVAARYRHQGLGSLLLKFIEQQAMNLGYYKIVLSVYAANLQALHAYRRAGYRDVGVFRNHGYRKGKLYDMVYMERLLPVDMEMLDRYYRETYPFYEEYFRREEALYEAQMLRNGMIRSQENPGQWIPGSAHADYVDDWNGQTVRVVKNAPALEEIMEAEEKAREETAEEAVSQTEAAAAPEEGAAGSPAPEETCAREGEAAAPCREAAEEAVSQAEAAAAPEEGAERKGPADSKKRGHGSSAAAPGGKRRERKRKRQLPLEEDGPLEGQILLDEVIGRQEEAES